MARIVALLFVVLIVTAPSAVSAAAESQTFNAVPVQSQNQVGEQPGVTVPTTQAESGSIGPRELVLIGAGIVVLIGIIWLAISRDARRATASRLRAADAPGERSATRAARRGRRLSAAERRRRKRGRATK